MRSLLSSVLLVASSLVALPALADPCPGSDPSAPIQGVVLQDIGFQSDAWAVSGHRAVGDYTDADYNSHAAMWDLRHPANPPITLGEYASNAVSHSSQATAVDGRWAVGVDLQFDADGNQTEVALLWDLQSPGAAPTKLPWDGSIVIATGIHGSKIVGIGLDADGVPRTVVWNTHKPWKAPRVLPTDLPTQPTAVGSAFITGAAYDSNSNGYTGVFWELSDLEDGPIALSYSGGGVFTANATAGRWGAGLGYDAAGVMVPLLWDLHHPENEPKQLPGLADASFVAGMDKGHMVGGGADYAEGVSGGLLWSLKHSSKAPRLLLIEGHETFALSVDGARVVGSAQDLTDYDRHAAYWQIND